MIEENKIYFYKNNFVKVVEINKLYVVFIYIVKYDKKNNVYDTDMKHKSKRPINYFKQNSSCIKEELLDKIIRGLIRSLQTMSDVYTILTNQINNK